MVLFDIFSMNTALERKLTLFATRHDESTMSSRLETGMI